MTSLDLREPEGRVRETGLPSGSLRVSVYAGIDPAPKEKPYLVETIPAGPFAGRDAERVRTRLLNEVVGNTDKGRSPTDPHPLWS